MYAIRSYYERLIADGAGADDRRAREARPHGGVERVVRVTVPDEDDVDAVRA